MAGAFTHIGDLIHMKAAPPHIEDGAVAHPRLVEQAHDLEHVGAAAAYISLAAWLMSHICFFDFFICKCENGPPNV